MCLLLFASAVYLMQEAVWEIQWSQAHAAACGGPQRGSNFHTQWTATDDALPAVREGAVW